MMSGASELELETVVVEAPVILNDMANLKLGSSCSCDDQSTCGCEAKKPERKKSNASFPYFWRKTKNNPFVKNRKDVRRRLNGTFEIIQPSVLNYIGPVKGDGQGDCSGSDANPVSSWGASTIVARNVSPIDSISSPSGPGILPSSSSAAPLALPDFNSLSLGSEESANPGDSGRCKGSAVNVNGILEVGSALVNFKLDPPGTRSRSARRPPSVAKAARKSRIRATFKQAILPPIMEDDYESETTGVFSNNTAASSASAAPSSPNLNCSQQALMENSGARWSSSQESSDQVDDVTIDELASYLDVFVYIPKKMSPMAEMMYT